MTGSELAAVIALALAIAAAAGFALGWLWERRTRPAPPQPPPDPLAERLAAAEAARNTAIRELEETRTRFSRQIAAKDAELQATMEGLGLARREADALRRELAARGEGGT
jgi:hypothetical protein